MKKASFVSYDIRKIKSAVTRNPRPFLRALYGYDVTQVGDGWRVGSKGGRCFDTRTGELLCVTFNGDPGQGDCIAVWQSHYKCDFLTALAQIAGLYKISAGTHFCKTPPVQRHPIPNPEARLKETPDVWSALETQHLAFWEKAVDNLNTNHEAQAAISDWRGWPIRMVKRLALGQVIGFTDFDWWPKAIAPQSAAFFRVLQPELHRDSAGVFCWRWVHVQCRVRFLPGATRRDKRPLSWINAPKMKSIGRDDGANAPLVLSKFGHDPEQPGIGAKCECIIVCAGEWDAITIVALMEWIDETGMLTVPEGLAIVGIRGEGPGGTDAFLRWYNHWQSTSAILLADADSTGSRWFESTDRRPCFAEQLERRGMRILGKAPKPNEELKDVNDLYRAGLLHRSHIEQMLTEAGFSMEGGSK